MCQTLQTPKSLPFTLNLNDAGALFPQIQAPAAQEATMRDFPSVARFCLKLELALKTIIVS
jgi:hypothetical protein